MLPGSGVKYRRFSPIWTQLAISLAMGLAAASCQGATPAPVPTPQYWRVQYTPALAWMSPDFNLCIRQQAGYALAVSARPAAALDIGQAEISLRWGAAAESAGYLAEIGSDDLAAVVNPQNPVKNLSASQVTGIFSGAGRTWSTYSKSNSNPIQVWVYPAGNEIRQFFEEAFAPVSLNPAAHLAPDPAAMRQAVADDPSAIGFLPGRWVDSSVRQLPITGISETSLRQPILAITQTEPQGAQKEWLLCLQHSIAQK
jgi:ABC-type phosphate transport system substrate-binding protein